MPCGWRPLPGFRGYEISCCGEVRSYRTKVKGGKLASVPHLVRTYRVSNGYRGFRAQKSAQRPINLLVHRCVLLAFIGPPQSTMECAHLNGDRQDNRLTNLSWVSRSENQHHRELHGTACLGTKNSASKLTSSKVKSIRRLRLAGAIAHRYGITAAQVHNICAGKQWKHVD